MGHVIPAVGLVLSVVVGLVPFMALVLVGSLSFIWMLWRRSTEAWFDEWQEWDDLERDDAGVQ